MDLDLETKISELLENEMVTTFFVLDSVKVYSAGRRTMIAINMDRECGGITMDECADWNRRLSNWIEERELMDGPYIVEVASPGLDRPLTETRDFKRALGSVIQVNYRDAEGEPKDGEFELVEVRDEQLLLKSQPSQEEFLIALKDITKAKRVIKI